MSPSKIRQRVGELVEDGITSDTAIAKVLHISRVTAWNHRKRYLEARDNGEIVVGPRKDERFAPESSETFGPPKSRDELEVEVLATLEDSPEGFKRFFDRYAHISDPKIKESEGLAAHSKMFVEAAFSRCRKHPRGAVDGQSVQSEGLSAEDGCALLLLDGPQDEGTEPLLAARPRVAPRCGCSWKTSVLINVPPEHAKSAVFTVWMSVWRVAQDRDFKRVIISETETMAIMLCQEIAMILQTNELLRREHGEFYDDSARVRWRPAYGQIRVAGSRITRGYNILARGMNSQISSLRADEMVLDDMIGPQSVMTRDQRAKTSHIFFTVITSRNIMGRTWVLGTRWHAYDIYDEISRLTHPETEEPIWETITFPAVLDWETHEVLWPTLITWTLLQAQYRKMGHARFFLVYQQEPISAEDALVQIEWINGSDLSPDPDRGCLDRNRSAIDVRPVEQGWYRVASFDPTASKWAGLIVADVNMAARPQFECKVLWIERFRRDESVGRINFIGRSFHPKVLIVEAKGAFVSYVEDERIMAACREQGIELRPHQTNRNKHDPNFGIESLGADFQFGWIRLPYGDIDSRGQSLLLIHEATHYLPGDVIKRQPDTTDVLMALWFIKSNLMGFYDRQATPSDRRRGFRLPPHLRGRRWVREVVPG